MAHLACPVKKRIAGCYRRLPATTLIGSATKAWRSANVRFFVFIMVSANMVRKKQLFFIKSYALLLSAESGMTPPHSLSLDFGGMFVEYKKIFSTDEIKSILTELATEYDKTSGEPLTVLIVGGSAAIFQFFFKKEAKDIDFILTKASPIFEECKQIISKRFGVFIDELPFEVREENPAHFEKIILDETFPLDINSKKFSFRVSNKKMLFGSGLHWFRRYKHHVSNILSMLIEEQKKGNPLGANDLENYFKEIYAGCVSLSDEVKEFLSTLDSCPDLQKLRRLYFLEENYQIEMYERMTFILRRRKNVTDNEIIREILRYSKNWKSVEDIKRTFDTYEIKMSDRAVANIERCILPFVYNLPREEFLSTPEEVLQKRQHNRLQPI